MSTETISPLRQRMIEDMTARKPVRPRRQATSAVASVSQHFSNGLPTRPRPRISAASSSTLPRPASASAIARIMTGLRFLFRVTLRRLELAAEIYHIREPQKIPLVMNPFFPPDLHAMTSRSLAGKVTYIGPWLTTVASLAVATPEMATVARKNGAGDAPELKTAGSEPLRKSQKGHG
jgi:hypothetical protein